MARNTSSAILRSHGGGNKGTTSAGQVVLALPFYMADPTAANTTALTISSTNSAAVVLPANAILLNIDFNAAATGGSSPTFDMGWIEVDDAASFDVDGIVAEGDADAGQTAFSASTTTSGDDFDLAIVTDKAFSLTGGVGASAATGGAISGVIQYIVSDDGQPST